MKTKYTAQKPNCVMTRKTLTVYLHNNNNNNKNNR